MDIIEIGNLIQQFWLFLKYDTGLFGAFIPVFVLMFVLWLFVEYVLYPILRYWLTTTNQ